MLTKDLVKARIRGDRVLPSFLDPDDQTVLSEASIFTGTTSECVGLSVDEAESRLQDLISPRFAAGEAFGKLLFDRFEVEAVDEAVAASRWSLIESAAKARQVVAGPDIASDESWQKWKELFHSYADLTPEKAGEGLYGDLPGARKIVAFQEIEPEALINIHNVAQLQGLVLAATDVNVSVEGANLSQTRRLFTSLRFHRLIPSSIEFEEPGTFRFELGGPLSIFDGGALYGINICNFVPSLFALPKWSLEATVKFKKRQMRLKVTEKSGYRPLRHLAEGHVPEEFQAFVRAFNLKKSGWTASLGGDLISFGRDGIVVPDVSFENGNQKLSLELFHRWHAGALQARLDVLARKKIPGLMIGWSKSLKPKLPDADGTSWLAERCFSFGEFPVPQQVLTKILALSDVNP